METSNEIKQDFKRGLIKKIAIRFLFVPLFIFLFTLVPAGTFNYWEVYVFFGVLIVPMIFVLIYFFRNDPMFLERRTRGVEKEKEQKLVQIINLPVFISAFIIPGLDHRYGWSEIPVIVILLTDLLILGGYVFIFFVFRENSYASRIIEINSGQKVISTGLYSFVRHPMYLGVIIMYIPMPLALGSCWGMIPMVLLPVTLVMRIINEEKVLRENLEGYTEYCTKTKYRLIPGIW